MAGCRRPPRRKTDENTHPSRRARVFAPSRARPDSSDPDRSQSEHRAGGGSSATMMVFGSNFLPGATVTWNGIPLATAFIGVSQLSATIPQALLSAQGFAAISVVNPSGARSNSLMFTDRRPPAFDHHRRAAGRHRRRPIHLRPHRFRRLTRLHMAIGGLAPVRFIALGADGIVSGTPTAAGTFNFTVRVTDRSQASASKSLSLVVNPPPVSITTPSTLPPARLGVPYQQALAVSGGTAPYRWSVAEGLPAGVSLNASTGRTGGNASNHRELHLHGGSDGPGQLYREQEVHPAGEAAAAGHHHRGAALSRYRGAGL